MQIKELYGVNIMAITKKYLLDTLNGTELDKSSLCQLFVEVSNGRVYTIRYDHAFGVDIKEYVCVNTKKKFKVITLNGCSILVEPGGKKCTS